MRDEIMAYLEKNYAKLEEFWQIPAEIAIYWFANDYHGGQSHPLYEVLSTSLYRPSCLARGIETEGDETAQMMYEDLVCVFNV